MAKGKIIIFYILCIIVLNSCSEYGSFIANRRHSDKDKSERLVVKSFKKKPDFQIRDRIQKAYYAELGVSEKTGNNDGERVEEYLAVCGLSRGNPWCAAFVSSIFHWNGVEAPLSGYSPNWFPKSNVIWSRRDGGKTPQKGDVGGLYYASKKRIAHVFFIDKWGDKDDNFVVTIEGNTSLKGEREGQGVEKLRRMKREIYKVSQ